VPRFKGIYFESRLKNGFVGISGEDWSVNQARIYLATYGRGQIGYFSSTDLKNKQLAVVVQTTWHAKKSGHFWVR
jgi:hypothetical protein